jgi:DNA-binding transcriptional MerR regulator
MKETKLNITTKSNSVAIYQNEAFDNGFYQYFKDIERNKISQVLNNTDRKLKFDSITYRELNSWAKEGLLTVNREGREWRKFSIIDAVWVKLIKELRGFGMSREQLKVAKQSLEFESEKCGVKMPMLEFYTAFIIGAKMPVLLLVFKNGIAVPCSLTQYKVAKEIVGVDNHVQISLNELLQGMFPEVDLKPYQKAEMPLDVDEMELLAFLRVGEYENVEIKYSKGRIDLIEGTERQVTEKVFDILNAKEYEEVTIRKRDDGVITSVIRKKKKKLSK